MLGFLCATEQEAEPPGWVCDIEVEAMGFFFLSAFALRK
jgi:hypothetical protein